MLEKAIRLQELLGKEVIALKDGSYQGKIQTVVINPLEKKVVGVYVKLKGILSGRNFVPFSSIQAFGNHSVTIKEEYDPENISEQTIEEKDIIGMPIITISGTMLGQVDDFSFEKESGSIIGYILSEGLVPDLLRGQALLKGEKVSRIGKDVIIALEEINETDLEELNFDYAGENSLADDTLEEIEDYAEENDVPLTAENAWQNSIKKAKVVSEQLSKKIKIQAEKVGDEAKEIWSEAQKKAQQQLEKLNLAKEKWQVKIADMENEKEDRLEDQVLKDIKGKTINEPLFDNKERIIVKPGQIIDDTVVNEVLHAGKLQDLFKLIAAKEVDDKIIEIEKIDKE